MNKVNDNITFPGIHPILSSLENSGASVTIDNAKSTCIDYKGERFFLDYSEKFLRLIMVNNDIYSLYGVARLLKDRADIPTIQYCMVYQGSEDTPHPTLEWRFDDKELYIAHIVNSPILGENCLCTNIKLLNGKLIEDYERGKALVKK